MIDLESGGRVSSVSIEMREVNDVVLEVVVEMIVGVSWTLIESSFREPVQEFDQS